MVSDSQQSIVTPSIKSWGLYYEKYRDVTFPSKKEGKTVFMPVIKGRFDGHCNANGRIAYIETKNFEKNFPFSCIDEDKRRWSKLLEEEFKTTCWIFLIMGKDNPTYNQLNALGGPKHRPKRAWLFTMEKFYWIEMIYERDYRRKSLPYYWADAKERHIQDDRADAEQALAGFALKWQDGLWRLPENHSFRKAMGL